MKLTNIQNRAVTELIEYFKEIYNNNDNDENKIIEFKAPTGSGKTFMIANFIDKAITYNREFDNNQKIVFVIVTLSSADLPKQMENNLNDYLPFLENRNINIERQESPSVSDKNLKDRDINFFPENEKVLIFGSSSFGAKRIFTERQIFSRSFLQDIKNDNYKLIYIRDEAHYGGDKKNKTDFEMERFESKIQEEADFVIKMTATPKGSNKQVIINEKELQEDNIKLLKNEGKYNFGISDKKETEITNVDLLSKACEQFTILKNEYYNDKEKEPGLFNINPAMLIQVSDKHKENEEEFEKNILEITNCLKSYGLNFVKYFSNEKIDSELRNIKNLKDISKNNSDVDAIIFKVGPATGWNIPRACMLVQLRNVSSDTLHVQTIGRIKRNPNPDYDFEDSSIANNYYIYSNNSDYKREIKTYKLRKEYENEKFATGNINPELLKKASNTEKYNSDILDLLSKKEILKFANDYIKHFKNLGYLIGRESIIIDKDSKIEKVLVEQKILNSVQLEKFTEDLKLRNLNLFPKKIINSLNGWFDLEIKNHPNNNISIYLFWYILFRNYLIDIQDAYKKSIKFLSEKGGEQEYLIKIDKNLPKDLFAYKSNFDIKINEEELNYAYVNTVNIEKNEHFFDSKTEQSFVSQIINYLKKNNEQQYTQMWSRNPVRTGLSFEYYAEDNEIKNSYPDFIIIYKGHQILIEVKNYKKDYDPEKTKRLIEAYSNYIIQYNKEDSKNKSLTILVAFVDNEKLDYMMLKGASTINSVNERLFNSEMQRPAQTIDDIFEKIN